MAENKKLIKITCILLCTCIIFVFAYFAVRYLALAFLPFILAWGIALSLEKPTQFIVRNAKIPKKAAHIVAVILFGTIVFYLFFLFFSMLLREAKDVYERLASDSSVVDDTVKNISESLRLSLRNIPYLGKKLSFVQFSESFENRLSQWLVSFSPQIVSFVGVILGKFFKTIPYIAIFLFVTVLASFYFSADLEKINRTLALLFPEKQRHTLFLIKEELFSVVFGYIRAYSLIIALTFVELFIGLSIIGTRYTFLISFLIAIIDILPVLGAGTVLVPWGIILLLFGNLRSGVCILVLYLIITVIRQMAEPKIVGNFLGLHPLCTLLAMYVGVQLCGIWGLFLFPVAFIVARNVYRRLNPVQSFIQQKTDIT